MGLSHYYVGILKYDHEQNLYTHHKSIRLEKAHNIEGNIIHLEKVNHLAGWFVCITFRSFRLFKVMQEPIGVSGDGRLVLPQEHRKVIRDVVSLGFLKMQQHDGNIIVLSMGGVTMVRISESDASITHSCRCVRTDRIGLFPGFCSVNFPYAISQIGDFNGEEFLEQKNLKYLGWASHHIGM